MVSRYTDGLDETFTGEVAQAHQDGLLTSVAENAQALINPDALAELKTTLASSIDGGANLVEEVVSGLQSSLASAIGDVFILVVILLAIAWIATTQLEVLPLRGRGGAPGGIRPGGAPGGPPTPEAEAQPTGSDSSD